jgi:hypothetical protein
MLILFLFANVFTLVGLPPTPSRAATFAKRKKAANGGYMGSFIKLDVDGKTIGNPSLKKYYKGMI